ncbi:MAG TPA: hypothetical protein DCQ31_13595, partial [Bacteroidales bacterium]|nr:hypothetical protein [Bacteroidales bacterium]
AALNHYLEATKQSIELKDRMAELLLQNNIGAVYDRMLNYNKALQYYLKLKENIEADTTLKWEGKGLHASLFNNIGNIYASLNNPEAALKYYTQSKEIAEKNNEPDNLARVLRNIGNLQVTLKKFDEAEKNLLQALEIRRKQGNKSEIFSSILALGKLYNDSENTNKALKYALSADSLAVSLNAIPLLHNSTMLLSDVYYKKGDYLNALLLYRAHKDYNDSLYNLTMTNEITRLELDYQFKEKEKEMIEQQNKREFNFVLMLVASVVLIAFVLMLYLSLRYRVSRIKAEQKNLQLEKQALELNLEIRSKELITNVMYMVKKNEMLKEVTEKLLSTVQRAIPDNRVVIQQAIVDIQSSVDDDVWEEFEVRFNQVHSDFYNKLSTYFEELTPNEKKLCAFLKLNMSTKEISALTQQSARSIEVARARLRKKLNIANTNVNLVNFLSEL